MTSFPIAALGASAGGLEAIVAFFDHIPDDSGIAFVVIVHLLPDAKSNLAALLQPHTNMIVQPVADGVALEPNRVYVIPPHYELGLHDGRLYLLPLNDENSTANVLDHFLVALAKIQQSHSLGIILSGAGTDGTRGIEALKEVGGLVLAQSPSSAKFDSMPLSAINTGLVDFTLPPEKMAEIVVNHARQLADPAFFAQTIQVPLSAVDLNKILLLLQSHTGHDFISYRQSTIQRRIGQRMLAHNIERSQDYVRYLQHNPAEIDRLLQAVLIGVTRFFRDAEAFAMLKQEVLPALFTDRTADESIRIWVPGCATGEEVYSLALLLREIWEQLHSTTHMQFFATDINAQAIQQARQGLFPWTIAADVSPERLARFFHKVEDGYQITREIRDMIVFAEQNVLQDPPFSQLDMISCRNLLIYLQPKLQKTVLTMCQYALKRGGLLFLGASETVDPFGKAFTAVSLPHGIFKLTGGKQVGWADTEFRASPFYRYDPDSNLPKQPQKRQLEGNALMEKLLLDYYEPAAALINEAQEVVYTYGSINPYLSLTPGKINLNIVEMARPELRSALMMAMQTAVLENKRTIQPIILAASTNETDVVNLIVQPANLGDEQPELLLVIFETAKTRANKQPRFSLTEGDEDNPHIAMLQQELAVMRQYLQSSLTEAEGRNQAIRSQHELTQMANEELQSTNEELNTSREEMQSVNEELATINTDLRLKNEALKQANDDLHNLMRTSQTPTIFLDQNLNIKSFTPAVMAIVPLISGDVGRPFIDIAHHLQYEGIAAKATQVLDSLTPYETEVETTDNFWYRLRIVPYLTLENVIDGVVITFSDISEQKRLAQTLARAQTFAENILSTLHEVLVLLDEKQKVVSANKCYCNLFETKIDDLVGQPFYQLHEGSWDIPQLRDKVATLLETGEAFEAVEIEHKIPQITRHKVLLNGCRVTDIEQERPLTLLTMAYP